MRNVLSDRSMHAYIYTHIYTWCGYSPQMRNVVSDRYMHGYILHIYIYIDSILTEWGGRQLFAQRPCSTPEKYSKSALCGKRENLDFEPTAGKIWM